MKRTILPLAALAVLAGGAQGGVTILAGPGNVQNDENVLFNDSSLTSTGLLVEGITNQSRSVVDFYGAGKTLVANGGQAKLEAQSGTFNALATKPHDPTMAFTSLIWNLNAIDDGSVTFRIAASDGAYSDTFSLDKNGQNFFRIIADPGTLMNTVAFTSTVGIQDVKQVRVGLAPVPEPVTAIALLPGLAMLAARRRWRK